MNQEKKGKVKDFVSIQILRNHHFVNQTQKNTENWLMLKLNET